MSRWYVANAELKRSRDLTLAQRVLRMGKVEEKASKLVRAEHRKGISKTTKTREDAMVAEQVKPRE